MRKLLVDAQYDEELHARKRMRYDGNLSTQSTESNSMVEEPRAIMNEKTQLQAQSPIVSPTTTDRIQAKRDEIRQAHRYLQEHADPGLLHIEPLPFSGPKEEGQDRFDHEAASTVTIRQHAAHSEYNHDQKQSSNGAGDSIDVSQAPNNQPSSQPPDSQHTDTLTLPISEATLAPSLDLANEESVHLEPGQNTSQGRKAGRERVMARLRSRINAYLAAQEGSYTAWEDVSPVSAGANHTEEETEL